MDMKRLAAIYPSKFSGALSIFFYLYNIYFYFSPYLLSISASLIYLLAGGKKKKMASISSTNFPALLPRSGFVPKGLTHASPVYGKLAL